MHPADDIVQDIVQSGTNLPLKHKITLLDKIVDKKEQFKDEHLKKLVQSDKYSIRRLVKNIQKKKEEKKNEIADFEKELPTTQDPISEIQPSTSQKKIEQPTCIIL